MEDLSRNQQQKLRMMAAEFVQFSMCHLHSADDFDDVYQRLAQINLDHLHILLSQD